MGLGEPGGNREIVSDSARNPPLSLPVKVRRWGYAVAVFRRDKIFLNTTVRLFRLYLFRWGKENFFEVRLSLADAASAALRGKNSSGARFSRISVRNYCNGCPEKFLKIIFREIRLVYLFLSKLERSIRGIHLQTDRRFPQNGFLAAAQLTALAGSGSGTSCFARQMQMSSFSNVPKFGTMV